MTYITFVELEKAETACKILALVAFFVSENSAFDVISLYSDERIRIVNFSKQNVFNINSLNVFVIKEKPQMICS